MTELKIDEDEIKAITDRIKELIEHISREIKWAENKNEDIFVRYMSYLRLGTILRSTDHAINLHKHILRCGHEISNPVFDTPASKEYGWNSIDISKNPFFCQEERKEEFNDIAKNIIAVSIDEIDEDMKEKIKQLVINKFTKETSH